MKLTKKLGVVVGSVVATFALSCCAWAGTLQQTASSSGSVKIEWERYGNEKTKIEISDSSDFSNPTTIETNYSGHVKSITGLLSGVSRWVRVTVGSKAPETIEVVTAPKKDKSQYVVQTGCAVGSATIKWDAIDGANGYDVYLGGAYNSTVTTNQATVKLAKDTYVGVTPFRKSSTGYKAEASEKINVQNGLHIKPLPGNVTALKTAMGSTLARSIAIDWDNVTGASGYELQYCNYNGKSTSTIDTSTSIAYIKNPKNMFYKVKVRAYVTIAGKKCYGAWSNQICTAVDMTASYDNVKVSNLSKKKKAKVKVSWLKIKGATKYEVYMSVSNGAGFKRIKTTKKRYLVVTKYKKKKLKFGKKYYFKVVAVRTEGKKKYSSIKNATRYVSVIKIGK